jgi:prevent-host-death family protein
MTTFVGVVARSGATSLRSPSGLRPAAYDFILVKLTRHQASRPVRTIAYLLGDDMSETVNIYEAKTNLSRLVERAAKGEEIVIAKAGKPKAKLVPYRSQKKRSGGANLLGITFIAEDFDDPLPPEVQASFEDNG